jgi:cell wall-associated NlpC family hydrolase
MPAATAAAACGQKISGTGFTVSCAVLSQGDTGPAVAVLETALKQTVDGQFTAATGNAVSAAQQAAGLPATATTDRKTWKSLSLTGTPVCTPGSTTPALPKDYKAQQKVRKKVAKLAAALLQQPGTTTSKIALAAVRFEKKQIGKPYVYGAAGPSAFDCSGLVQYVYALSGRSLPRTAQDQYNATVHIAQSAKEPGDLIFWGAPYGVYHVGIYAGGNMMWDAPYPGATVTFRQIWDNTYAVGRVL